MVRVIHFALLALALILAHEVCGSQEVRSSQEDSTSQEDGSSQESYNAMVRKPWTLSDPVLTIKQGRVHVSIQGTQKLKWIRFYMSINKSFKNFKTAEFKIRLKCNKRKQCQRRVGPAIQEGDVIHYGMLAKIRKQKGTQKFCCEKWTPIPLTTTAPVAVGSCSVLADDIPTGCLERLFTVPSGFEDPGTGRRNPERGLYKYTETKASSWSPVSSQPLADWVNSGTTLIYRIYVLDSFVDTNITDDILQKITEDLEAIKSAGLKVMLRFSYSIDINVIDDAPPEQLKKHIEQLAPILQKYVGVIALVQTGFIGVWGEWYYTKNYGNEGIISSSDYENRRQVVFALLNALPASRQIEIRAPDYKRVILTRQSAVTSEEAHTDAKVARIGHHNDCFLASDTDFGTYKDKAEEYPYLQNDTLYVSQGGETCNPNSPRSDCTTALKELSELHYTYLNSQYHPDVLKSWQDQGCYTQVELSLGYRLVGVSSLLPATVTKGSNTIVGLKMRNIGWASPINYRSVQLIMIHNVSGEVHLSPLKSDLDLRNWLPGDYELDVTLSVPESASVGEYEVLLKLPDGEGSLESLPEYNIVMENLEYEKDPSSRLNLLGTITVT